MVCPSGVLSQMNDHNGGARPSSVQRRMLEAEVEAETAVQADDQRDVPGADC